MNQKGRNECNNLIFDCDDDDDDDGTVRYASIVFFRMMNEINNYKLEPFFIFRVHTPAKRSINRMKRRVPELRCDPTNNNGDVV